MCVHVFLHSSFQAHIRYVYLYLRIKIHTYTSEPMVASPARNMAFTWRATATVKAIVAVSSFSWSAAAGLIIPVVHIINIYQHLATISLVPTVADQPLHWWMVISRNSIMLSTIMLITIVYKLIAFQFVAGVDQQVTITPFLTTN